MARTSELDKNPDIIDQFAAQYVEDKNREQLGLIFGVHVDTITRWTKDPRIQAAVSRLRDERVNNMARKIDSKLLAQLDSGKFDEEPELLIKLRREIIPVVRKGELKVTDETAAGMALYRNLLTDPVLAARLGVAAQADADSTAEEEDPYELGPGEDG